MLKVAIRHAATEDQVRHRMLPVEVVKQWSDKLVELKDEVSEVLREEKEEKQILQAEMELRKSQNMIDHQDEIFSRPARTWFQSEKDKQSAQSQCFHQTTKEYVSHLFPAKSRDEHETGVKSLTKQIKAGPDVKVMFLHFIFSLLLTWSHPLRKSVTNFPVCQEKPNDGNWPWRQIKNSGILSPLTLPSVLPRRP